MNILFIGGGRRVSLAQRFSKYGRVFAYETTNTVPVSTIATIILGQKWSDSEIRFDISETIAKHNIDVAIPLQDEAIPVCSGLPKCMCSNSYAASICYDKKLLERFMMEYFARYYPSVEEQKLPMIAKPRYGFGSHGIVKFTQSYDTARLDTDTQYVFQSLKYGQEYTVDAYFNKKGKCIGSVPRLRMRVGDGEVIDAQTIKHDGLIQATQQIGEKIGLIGPICMQYIVDDKQIWLIEINARFGGGCILSLEAGFDMVKYCVNEYVQGYTMCDQHDVWRPNLYMRRYFQEFFHS